MNALSISATDLEVCLWGQGFGVCRGDPYALNLKLEIEHSPPSHLWQTARPPPLPQQLFVLHVRP